MFYFSTYSANLFLFDIPESSPGQCNSRLGSMHYHWSKRCWQWIEYFCSGAINGPYSNWNKLWWSVFLFFFPHAAAKSLQSYPTLCDPIDGSPPNSPVPGILQARTLEWVAISFSSSWKWKVKVKSLSRVQLLATSWTAAYQAPPSMGFSRQEYWSGVPLPSPSSTQIIIMKVTERKENIFL